MLHDSAGAMVTVLTSTLPFADDVPDEELPLDDAPDELLPELLLEELPLDEEPLLLPVPDV